LFRDEGPLFRACGARGGRRALKNLSPAKGEKEKGKKGPAQCPWEEGRGRKKSESHSDFPPLRHNSIAERKKRELFEHPRGRGRGKGKEKDGSQVA